MKLLLLPIAVSAALVLAACGDAPDNPVSTQTNVDGSTTMQIQVPEALAPAADAIANPEQAFDNLRQQAGSMTEDAKVQAVQAARTTAEEAARLIGQSEIEIQRAGDNAEQRARDALGVQ